MQNNFPEEEEHMPIKVRKNHRLRRRPQMRVSFSVICRSFTEKEQLVKDSMIGKEKENWQQPMENEVKTLQK